MDKLGVDLQAINAAKAIADVRRWRTEIVAADAQIAKLSAGTSFAGAWDRQLDRATRRHAEFIRTVKRQESTAGVGGALSGIGGALAGAGIGTAVVTGANASLAAAKAAEDANRVLRASAVETGIAYDKLAAKAKNFGDQTALSNTNAERTFAQLVTFANAAGRTDKIDEFTKRFSDLAAAKGINASQLGDISRQLNALTDEATDKLLNANPSAFYDKFARSINKTAETLTDAEKRAAIFDEVIRKGAIFDGEAEKRTKSFAGEADQLRKTIDDLTASAGRAIVPIAQFFLKGGQLPTTPSDAEREAIRENARILGEARVKEIVESLRASDAKIKAARANPTGSLENFALSQIDISKTFIDGPGREKAIKDALENANLFVADLKKRLQSGLSSGSTDIAKLANAEFRRNINLFDPETRDKFINDFSTSIAEGFRQTLSKTRVTVAELRKTLSQVGASPDLTQKDRAALSNDFTAAILSQINAGRARVAELGKSTDALFRDLFAKKGEANPFVAVFSEAEQAIERTRLATAALTEDLQKQALQMVNNQAANALFSARLDTTLRAVDLRSDAQNFRTAGRSAADQARADQFANDAIRRFQENEAQGLFKNPAFLAQFQSGTSAKTGLELFNFQRKLEESGGLFRNPAFDDQIRRDIESRRVESGELSASERLQRQLSAIRDLNPQNEFQRAEADRKIIALTQGLSPGDLTDSQRNDAAGAREREAGRLLGAEGEAKKERAEALEIQKSIDKNIKALLEKANTEGLQGIIRIINDAEDSAAVELGKRPTAKDVQKLDER